ncbi:MAG: putative glycoside hydrolase [Paludibacteraceae bacterium]|nr:putative glycoside hydrolase [Paludibacteraceae bacterium]
MRKIFALYTILLLIVTTGCSNSSMQKKSNEMDSIQPDKEAPILTPLPSPDTIAPTIDSILAMREKEIPPLPPIKKEIKRNGDLLVPPVKVKGIYVTGPTAGIQRMNELTDLVVSTGMNTIVLDIKNDGGNITYKMEHPIAKEIGACKRFVRNMPALLDTLHAKNIYVIGRIVCFKDSYLAKAKPQLAIQNPDSTLFTDSKGQIWVNPYNEAVWDYLCSLAEKAIEDGFDEIQFDYVRFPIGEDANQANYGVDINSYTREDALNNFFAYVEKRLHKKGIIYGADLFGTVIGSDTDRERTGQDYVDIASMTDNICPMIYPSHYGPKTFGIDIPDADPYNTIYRALKLSKKQLSKRDSSQIAVVRPWLQCFTAPWRNGHIKYGSKEIRDQIKAVYDAGYEEWILWNASNRYDYVKEALLMDELP